MPCTDFYPTCPPISATVMVRLPGLKRDHGEQLLPFEWWAGGSCWFNAPLTSVGSVSWHVCCGTFRCMLISSGCGPHQRSCVFAPPRWGRSVQSASSTFELVLILISIHLHLQVGCMGLVRSSPPHLLASSPPSYSPATTACPRGLRRPCPARPHRSRPLSPTLRVPA